MNKQEAIKHIENLYPCDSAYEDTADTGRELLEQAVSEIGWRGMSEQVLIKYAQLCIDEAAHEQRIQLQSKYQVFQLLIESGSAKKSIGI